MPKRKPPRTGHRNVVTKDNPVDAPNYSVPVTPVIDRKHKADAATQSTPTGPIVDKKNPVEAPNQSMPVSTPTKS